MDNKPTVFEAVGLIISEMGGVGKNQYNKDQNYKFRGVDDVLKELRPALAKHGVFFAPNIIERIYDERISKQGTVGHVAHLHVEYKVYGPSGDFFEISTWGEGLDYSDKATNKAMTAAFKYAIFEVFAVSDPDDDGDHSTLDGGETQNQSSHRPQAQSRPQTNVEPSEDIAVILKAAAQSDNEFLQSLAKQFNDKGKLSDNQIGKGVTAAMKILTTPRQSPVASELPERTYEFDEEPF